jgi:hypothetical protein
MSGYVRLSVVNSGYFRLCQVVSLSGYVKFVLLRSV